MSGFSPGGEDELELELRAMAGRPLPVDGPLAPLARELDELGRRWAATRPPLPAPRRPRARPWLGAALVAGALAASALALVGPPAEGSGVRAMGGLPVDLRSRRGAAAFGAPDGFRAGDELRLALRSPVDGVVEVWTVQADGVVSVLEPGRRVRGGERWALDGAARLDDAGAREWLVVNLAPADRDRAGLEREALAALPDPSAMADRDTFVVEVTRRP